MRVRRLLSWISIPLLVLAACGQDDPKQVLGPGLAIGVDPNTGATVETNKDDYVPGEIVHLAMRGWAANEDVRLYMTESPDTHGDVDTTVTVDENGEWNGHFYDVLEHDLGVVFTLTATGGSSGSVAVVTFTDANVNLRSNLAGVTFVVTVTNYTGINCTGTPTADGTPTITSTGSNFNMAPVTSRKFVAAATSVEGASFTNWTGDVGESNVTNGSGGAYTTGNTICSTGNTGRTLIGTYDASPDLELVKSTSSTFTVGSNVTYAIQVKNTGTASAQAGAGSPAPKIRVTDPVPTGLSYVSGGGSNFTCSLTSGQVICELATGQSIPPAASRSFDLIFTVTSDACSAGITNAATVGQGNEPAGNVNALNTGSVLTAAGSISGCIQPASKLAFTTVPFTKVVGECSGVVTVGTQNASNALVNPTSNVTVNLTTSSTGGAFYSDAACTAPITSVSILTTASTANFYYKDSEAGTPTLTADDPTSPGLTSATQQEAISQAATSLNATDDPSPSSVFNAPVKFEATVSVTAPGSGFPTGSVTFYDGGTTGTCDSPGTSLGSGTLAGGIASIDNITSLTVGSHNIIAKYPGDANYIASCDEDLIHVIVAAATTTTVVSDDDTSVWGQGVIFTATVSSSAGTPGGTVNFYEFDLDPLQSCGDLNGASAIGTGVLSGGTASSASISNLEVGAHTITACYLGSGSYAVSEGFMTQTVEKAVTSLVLSATPDPTYFGVNPALSAAISVTSPGAGTPTGTVNFYDGGDCTTLGTSLGSGTVSGGTASLTSGAYPALNAAPNHTLVACYGGDTHFKASGDDEPHEVKQAVTQTALSDSPASTQFGVTVTFTATVSVTAGFGSGTPTGNVKFVLGTDCTAAALTGVTPNATNPPALSSGQAVFTTNSLAVGTPTVSACYEGTTNFKESADDEAHVVTAATTTTTVTVTPSTQQYSDQTLLKAEVTPFQILNEELTGTVTFYVETAAVSCSSPGAAVAVGSDGILAADDGVAEFTYAIGKAASATAYVVTGCFASTKAEFANSYNTGSLTVTKEEATIYDVSYPNPVNTPPGGTGSVTFAFKVKEKSPDLTASLAASGDLANALNVKITLTPFVGSAIDFACAGTVSGSGYSQIVTFSCPKANIPVETYLVKIEVTGNYYTGEDESVLTVNDPSLGFVTGGGTYEFNGGRVNFGFVGKAVTNKNNTVYKGNVLVIRHKSNGEVVRIKSNVFSSMSLNAADKSATLIGKANYSVNGVVDNANYDFYVWVQDNGTSGAGQDKFGLYHAKSNAVAGYEIRTSSTIGGTPASAKLLTGGNIQIPQGGGK